MTSDLLTEINHASRAYCAQARALTLTATDLYDWLESLPPARRAEVRQRGLRASRAEPEFLRFCLERRGMDLWSFMADNLSRPAFDLWTAPGPCAGNWPLLCHPSTSPRAPRSLPI
jgi:hypothetical protein